MKRMTNSELERLALEYKLRRSIEATAKADAEGIRDQLLEQLKIRKKDELTVGTTVITRKVKETRVWIIAELRKRLTRKLFAEAVPPTPRVGLLDAAVKAGTLSQADLDACVDHVEESKPYVDVRIIKAR